MVLAYEINIRNFQKGNVQLDQHEILEWFTGKENFLRNCIHDNTIVYL